MAIVHKQTSCSCSENTTISSVRRANVEAAATVQWGGENQQMHRVSPNRLVIMIFPITFAILGAYLALYNSYYDSKFLRACQLLYKFMVVLSVAKFPDSPLKNWKTVSST